MYDAYLLTYPSSVTSNSKTISSLLEILFSIENILAFKIKLSEIKTLKP